MKYDFQRFYDLSREFYNVFKGLYPDISFECKFAEELEITIPAVNKEFGDLKILPDKDEIVIRLGEHFHIHFERYSTGGDINDYKVRKQIIVDAIDFIDDVLNDRILLKVKMKGQRVVSSSIEYLEENGNWNTIIIPLSGILGMLLPKKSIIKTCTWSGKLRG